MQAVLEPAVAAPVAIESAQQLAGGGIDVEPRLFAVLQHRTPDRQAGGGLAAVIVGVLLSQQVQRGELRRARQRRAQFLLAQGRGSSLRVEAAGLAIGVHREEEHAPAERRGLDPHRGTGQWL